MEQGLSAWSVPWSRLQGLPRWSSHIARALLAKESQPSLSAPLIKAKSKVLLARSVLTRSCAKWQRLDGPPVRCMGGARRPMSCNLRSSWRWATRTYETILSRPPGGSQVPIGERFESCLRFLLIHREADLESAFRDKSESALKVAKWLLTGLLIAWGSCRAECTCKSDDDAATCTDKVKRAYSAEETSREGIRRNVGTDHRKARCRSNGSTRRERFQ
jgi:hypothetical protein